MGIIHNYFDRNNKDDISMITRYPVLEKDYKDALKKHPNGEVTFYIEMVNDKY